jgi:hypothetical protein
MKKASTRLGYALPILFALLIPARLSAQVRDIVRTAAKLKAVPVDTELPGTEVPDEASVLLTQFKHELRDLIAARLADAGRDATPARLQESILNDLSAGGIELRSDLPGVTRSGPLLEDAQFGFIQKITIGRPSKHEDMLIAVITLQIPCGSDSSLYIFQWEKTAWKLVLAQEADGYRRIDGAQGEFDYSVSPPDAQGNWFAATSDVNPWCTSAWRNIGYKILRVGSDAYDPRVLISGQSGVYIGMDDVSKLRTTSNTASLSFIAEQGLNLGAMFRIHLLNFQISGDQVMRVAPLALHPEGFLDEWFDLPWDHASRWVDQSQESQLHSWHEWAKKAGSGFANLRLAQPCGTAIPANRWVLGIDLAKKSNTDPDSLYFEISRTGGVFRILRIAEVRPSGCPGENPPDDSPELTLP